MKHCTGPRGAASAILLVGLLLFATGCGGSDGPAGAVGASPTLSPSRPAAAPAQTPDESPVAEPAVSAPSPAGDEPRPEQASDDGTWHARIVRAQERTLVLDKVEILSGAAAEQARAEDGDPDPGAEVPYVRNRNQHLRTLPVADDVDLQVIHCPQDGCAPAPWPYADLVAGKPLPYGTPAIPFTVTVVDGTVVALSEVYFP
jgi:hypothetical protein